MSVTQQRISFLLFWLNQHPKYDKFSHFKEKGHHGYPGDAKPLQHIDQVVQEVMWS